MTDLQMILRFLSVSATGRLYSYKTIHGAVDIGISFVSHYYVKRQLICNYDFFRFSFILNPPKGAGLYSSMIHKYIRELKTLKTMSVLSIPESIIVTNCKYQNIVS